MHPATGQAGETPATDSSSSQAESSPIEAETDKPAAEDAPVSQAAGNQSESSVAPADGEGGGDGGDAVAIPASLPQGWEITYAAALRRAQKKESLSKYASEFWKQYGGWDAVKLTDARETAVAIYDAFANNFGRKDQIDAALRELI
jgi:hypothetical protein